MSTDRKEARLSAQAGISRPPGRRIAAAVVALSLAAVGVSFAVIAFRRAPAEGPRATEVAENGLIAIAAGDPARISVVNLDGTGARQVTRGREPDPRAQGRGYFEESAPQWSPDGTRIAFIRWYDPGTSLCVIGVDSTGFRIIVPQFDGWSQLAWSPDGTTMAYYAGQDQTIHLVDADGT